METSDSEYFESADEDIVSDDEDTKTVKSPEELVKNLKIEDNKQEESKLLDKNKNKEETTETDRENNEKIGVEMNKNAVEKGDSQKHEKNKNSKVKLGLKLSENVFKDNQNIDKEIKQVAQSSVEDKEDNLWEDDEIDWAKESTNMWDSNDDWEPVEQPKKAQQPSQTEPENNSAIWGSWGNWGVSTILSTATQGVSHLTQGISTVLESGIGVPDPEELARINKAEKEEKSQQHEDDSNLGFGFNNLVMGVSHLTKLVETTGTKVISGGLDTLETIGKKTMEVLQEGDPGLKKKRAFLKIDHDKPVLSQLLREAKEKAEKENKTLEEQHFRKKAKNYETLFDDHQGLVHLEALEMLSKQCDIKLQTQLESYSGDSLTEMQETMEQVKELCELPDEDDEEQLSLGDIKEKLESAVSEINIPITYKKLIETWEETENWLNSLKLDICDERELHQQAIETLAQLTAIAVEQFHKTGELLLVKEHRSTADEADSLVQLTTTLTSLIGVVAAKFSDKLNVKSADLKNKEEINGLITNVFFEAANSSSYIQDAFQLLIPVLQVGAV